MNTEEILRQFVGAVVACFTHEIQNNLATIHVVAGLMDDMVEKGRSMDPAQMTRLAAMTNKHVRCALGLIRHLNSYAHRLDEGVSSFCVNDALEELLALTGRICREKQVVVRTASCDGRATVRNSPLLLQSLVFRVLQTILEETPPEAEGVTVSLRTRPSRKSATIEITTGQSPGASPWALRLPADQNIQALVSTLGIAMNLSPDRHTVTLQVPSRESGEG